jgi:hypothetical protein
MSLVRRLLLALFPPAWRERYGGEAVDLLGRGGHRAADTIDLLRCAIELRLSEEPHMRRTLAILAALAAAIGAAGLAWSVPQLTNGIVEVPSHWWSTLAASPLLVAAVLGVLAWLAKPAPGAGAE